MPDPTRSPLVIAHRGASGYRPEHTEAAYRLAFAQGADAVEPDIVVSRDGVLVLRHEHELSGSTDVAEHPEFADRRRLGFGESGEIEGWFTEDFTWAELATLRAREPRPSIRPESASHNDEFGILRFDDLLALLAEPSAVSATGQPTVLVAELKHANEYAEMGIDLPGLVVDALIRAGWRHDDPRLVFESFQPEALDALAGWGTRVLLVDSEHWPADPLAACARFDGFSCEVERIAAEPELVARLHEAGKLVYAYTLRAENHFLPAEAQRGNDPATPGNWRDWFTRVLDSGIDAVFADQPDLARLVVGGAD